eukprot:m.209538 g.209538  ORF g.209538 m.209538 type:complete len:112 (-) comp33041_c1_seq4:2005-2340(-)
MFATSTLTLFVASLVAVVAYPDVYIGKYNACHAQKGASAMAGAVNFQDVTSTPFGLVTSAYVPEQSYTITLSGLPGTFMVASDKGTWSQGGGDNVCDGDGETGLWQKTPNS